MTSLLKKVTTSLLAFVTALCLQPTPAAQSQAPREAKWERYAFPGDEFSVELPGMPFIFHTFRQITSTESETMRVFGHYADAVVYKVIAFDKPRRHETPERLAASVNDAYGATKDVAAGGFSGKEYRTPRGAARDFRTKKRAYLVKAFARAEGDPAVERFLDSLTLSNRPSGREITEPAAPAPITVAPPTSYGPGRGENAKTDKDQPPPLPELDLDDDDDPKRVFRIKDVTQKAIIVFKGDPGFTEEARRNYVSGLVRLRAVLRASGRVTDIAVIKTLPDGLTERAIYAARHIMFFPAQKNGRDVSQYVTLEYNFNIY